MTHKGEDWPRCTTVTWPCIFLFFLINSEYIPVEWEILSWKTSHSARVGVWVCEKKTQETKGMHISVMITWPPPEIWANWVDRPQTHAPCRYVQTHTRPRLRQIQTTEDWNTNIITSSLGLWVILTIPLVTRFSQSVSSVCRICFCLYWHHNHH